MAFRTVTAADGLLLAVEELGVASDPHPVVLLHGFASSGTMNWVRPGIAGAVAATGRRVVVPDARGHGRSAKPRDPGAYAGGSMARDVSTIFDTLGADSVDLVGYSMGALVAQRVAVLDHRVASLVLAGIGGRMLRGRRDHEAIAATLEGTAARDERHPLGWAFRNFARRSGNDLAALAAVQRGNRNPFDRVGEISVPTLVVAGFDDTLAGDPAGLAAQIPGARALVVPGNHLSAVVQPQLRDAIVDFVTYRR